jgi:hypothetical protein
MENQGAVYRQEAVGYGLGTMDLEGTEGREQKKVKDCRGYP